MYSTYNNNSNNTYKLILFLLIILVIASTITFSLFIRNIYMNMDEIREQEIKFRNDIAENSLCCLGNSTLIENLIKKSDKQL